MLAYMLWLVIILRVLSDVWQTHRAFILILTIGSDVLRSFSQTSALVPEPITISVEQVVSYDRVFLLLLLRAYLRVFLHVVALPVCLPDSNLILRMPTLDRWSSFILFWISIGMTTISSSIKDQLTIRTYWRIN